MILLLLCLITGVLKIHHIQEKSDFLLSNMAFFFIPAGVGMINYLDILAQNLIPLIVISVISTFITFAATVYSMKLALKLLNRRKQKMNDVFSSPFFGISISILTFRIGEKLQKKNRESHLQSSDHIHGADHLHPSAFRYSL